MTSTNTPPPPFDYPRKSITLQRSNNTYQTIDVSPADVKGVALLIHGFPDLSFGWRYQIPKLLKAGLRVICPDMLGYAGTSKPEELEAYSYKNLCEDLHEILVLSGIEKLVVIGHDWGGAIAWRFGQYFPSICLGVVSVCTPFQPPPPPSVPFISDEELISKFLPNFGYQIFFKSESSPKILDATIMRFLGPMFSKNRSQLPPNSGNWVLLGVLENGLKKAIDHGEGGWADVQKWGIEENDPELFYYLKTFREGGFRAPTNYYRTRRINYEDDQKLSHTYPPQVPCLLVVPGDDDALPVSMSMSPTMWACFDEGKNLEIETVNGDHWILQDARYRDATGEVIISWIERLFAGDWKPCQQSKDSVMERLNKVIKAGDKENQRAKY